MTNPGTEIKPETADLLNQIAESENVSPDSLLRRMLVRHTSVKLRQATADIQQTVSTRTQTEDISTTNSDPPFTTTNSDTPLCPYCHSPVSSTSNSNRNPTGTVCLSSIYRCEDRYCPLGMFVETGMETEHGDLRLLTEILDESNRRERYDI